LGVALVLSVAVNFRSMKTVAEKNRAEELWFEAFKGDHAELRNEAGRAIGELAKTSSAAADVLIEGLSDPRPGVRLSAIEGLEAAGPAARGATTALLKIQNTDDNDLVRRKAAELQKSILALPEGEFAVLGTLVYWGLPLLVFAGVAAAVIAALRRSARTVRSSR
jgi:hypothetical protein